LAVTTAACAILFLCPQAYILGLIGLGAGMSIALSGQLPLASEIAYNENALGTMIGVYNFFYMFGIILGANLVGLVIQMTSYNSMYSVIAGCGLAATLPALFIRVDNAPHAGDGGDASRS
jgi:MFS family permease